MRRFSEEETKEAIRTAQVFAPQFTADQYQKLVQMQQEMSDSGFIEAAWGVHQLERECGIPCAETLAKYAQLLKETAEVESRLSRLEEKRRIEEEQLSQIADAARQAKEERDREEKELEVVRKQAADEKKRLKEEVEQAVQEGKVSREDIATAVTLRTEVESHGLDLKLTLRLFEEFAGDEDAARHLAEAAAEYGSQLEARKVLRKENEALRVEEEKRQKDLAELKAERQREQGILSQCRSDIAEQDKLRRFWWRFHRVGRIMEYLATWGQFVPLRCSYFFCRARFWVNRGPSGFRANFVCPCCGLGPVDYDDEALTTLGLSGRAPIRIELGE